MLRIVSNKLKFDSTEIMRDRWRGEISKAQDDQKISFDLENDDCVDDIRIIKLMDGDIENIFLVELNSAGGDWQMPIYYFKIQQKEPIYKNKIFVWIPSKKEGNGNLTKGTNHKDSYIAEDNNYKDRDDRDDQKSWKAVKRYLNNLMD